MIKNIARITLLFGLTILLLTSCVKDGDWEDNIKLSQKEVKFDNTKNYVKITTEGKNWWVNEISFNGEQIDINNQKFLKNFILTKSEFEIERKNLTDIYIRISKNDSNKDRVLVIGLQDGNYFNQINVFQKK